MTEQLYTKKEAAERLHTTPWSVTRMVNNGSLPVVQVGKQDRIRQSDVDKYINNPVFLPKKGRVPKSAEAIKERLLTKAATPKDFRDALHSESEEMREIRKAREKAAKKARKKLAKQQQVMLTKQAPPADDRTVFSELQKLTTVRDPNLREAAEKALAPPEASLPAVDTPEYWRGLAESPLSTAAERNQYLAKAAQLENARRTPGFSLSSYTRG